MTKRPDTYVIVCGGTGGHIYPGFAVASALKAKEPGVELAFIGTKRRMESKIIPEAGYVFYGITVEGIQRRFDWTGLWKNLWAIILLCTGIPLWQSVILLRRIKPKAVFGTGGYFSGPVLFAAYLLGIPGVSMEPNVVPGMANRLLAPFLRYLVITHEESRTYFRGEGKCIELGTPVRPEIFAGRREEANREFGLEKSRLTLLVMGGSLGSRNINDAVTGMLRLIRDRNASMFQGMQIVHSVGKRFFGKGNGDEASFGKFYHPSEYFNHVDRLFPAVDLFIGRVGASTMGETTALGIPMILVPWRGVNQAANAEALSRKGAAILIYDDELTPDLLFRHVQDLYEDPEKLKEMAARSKALGKPDAASDIADLLMTISCPE